MMRSWVLIEVRADKKTNQKKKEIEKEGHEHE